MHFRQFKSLNQNPGGRVFAVGDVHGCLDALQALLEQIRFDPKVDQIVFVGDLADRGPDNIETLRYVLDNPCFHLVAGNHEDLLVEYVVGNTGIPEEELTYWLSEDGAWIADVDPEELRSICEKLRAQAHYLIEVTTKRQTRFGLTHAGYFEPDWFDPDKTYDDLFYRRLMWVRQRAEALPGELDPVNGVDFTVHGHTIFEQSWQNGNALFIDTGCFAGGKLTALDLGEFATTLSLEQAGHTSDQKG